VSPYPVLARFIAGLDQLEMRVDPELGPSTVALTLIDCDQLAAVRSCRLGSSRPVAEGAYRRGWRRICVVVTVAPSQE
jgi:hypothetical protein